MKRAYYAFLLIFTAQLHSGFVVFHIFEHPETHQKIILLGDRHDLTAYSLPNRAAVINLAHTLNAHVIVEDMSDNTLLYEYSKEVPSRPYINRKSIHDGNKFCSKSLSLTHHCKRKKISIKNVEFRHYTLHDSKLNLLWELAPSESSFLDMTASLKNELDPHVLPVLDDLHIKHISKVDQAPYLNKSKSTLSNQLFFDTHCLFLDVLIIDNIIKVTKLNPSKPIMVCAGYAHIYWLMPVLKNMGYACNMSMPVMPEPEADQKAGISHGPKYYTELELLPYFQKEILQGLPLKKCITERSIKRNDAWRITRAHLIEDEPGTIALRFGYSMLRKLFKKPHPTSPQS